MTTHVSTARVSAARVSAGGVSAGGVSAGGVSAGRHRELSRELAARVVAEAAQRVLQRHPPRWGTHGDAPCPDCAAAGRCCPRRYALEMLADLGVLPVRHRGASRAGLTRIA